MMTIDNPFIKEADEYKRDLNVVKHYMEDVAYYLHKQTGDDYACCLLWVREQAASADSKSKLKIKSPEMQVLTRQPNGDRQLETIQLTAYLKDIQLQQRLLAPTMTTYLNPSVKVSLTGEFIQHNIQRRNQSKREAFKAEQDGNVDLAIYKELEQKAFKISNNSVSGAQASKNTILHNCSAHSTLTSTCRTAASYGNANNERFLFGNRHYWSEEIILANIVSITRQTDYVRIAQVCTQYGLLLPTYEDVVECIEHSYRLYSNRPLQKPSLLAFIKNLSPLERAAFVYTGDFYHLAKHNQQVAYTFLDRLSTRSTEVCDDAEAILANQDSNLMAFISLLCADDIAGESLSHLKVNNADAYARVASTTRHILVALEDYRLLIETLWRTDHLPPSIAHIKNTIRRGVITSDTDSTIFTVQYWTQWFVGSLDFSEKSKAVAAAVVYLTTQLIIHVLATITAGMGVMPEHRYLLAMKNEYYFPVFVLTPMSKHYFAYIAAREGQVYSKYKLELKGVYLKDSNRSKTIRDTFRQTICDTLEAILYRQTVDTTALIQQIQQIEKSIEQSVLYGSHEYLVGSKIKEVSSYRIPNVSPYTYHRLWQSVFAPKYGKVDEPPYSAVKVTVNLNNITAITAWIAAIEDRALANRLDNWIKSNQKRGFKSFLLPRSIVQTNGIPLEIVQIMGLRSMIYGIVKPFYILLESLGVYLINEDLPRLCYDGSVCAIDDAVDD